MNKNIIEWMLLGALIMLVVSSAGTYIGMTSAVKSLYSEWEANQKATVEKARNEAVEASRKYAEEQKKEEVERKAKLKKCIDEYHAKHGKDSDPFNPLVLGSCSMW